MHIPEDHPIRFWVKTKAFKQLNKYADYMELSDAMRLELYGVFVKNAIEYRPHRANKVISEWCDIDDAMRWAGTPEGHEFWSIISSGHDFERVFECTIGKQEENDDDLF